jgi:sortase A
MITTRISRVLPLLSILIAGCFSVTPVRASQLVTTPPGWPHMVIIDRLGITAKIEPTAMASAEDVDAPHNLNEVAWYSRGHRPGDRGRAQIFGHLDSTCCPALFYHLRDLKAGDFVHVTYRSGKPLTFRVQWQATYPTTHMPLSFMYGSTTDHGLILVTCAGIFHRDGTGYDHRLVVYATLVPSR